MLNILIIEDEAAVRLLTKAKLKNEYNLLEAGNGVQALEVMEHQHIDLIIADIMMPEMDGYEFVQVLRSSGNMTPVIFLTAMNTFAYKKKGFETGVDDYMTKPIDYEELKWRMKALLRRAKIANEKQLTVGNLVLRTDCLTAECNGLPVTLTKKEFDLLYKLLSYPDVIFTKQQIMDEIWGYNTESDYNSIKTYISRLRNKFSECNDFELVSVRGLGYKAVIHETEGKP